MLGEFFKNFYEVVCRGDKGKVVKQYLVQNLEVEDLVYVWGFQFFEVLLGVFGLVGYIIELFS